MDKLNCANEDAGGLDVVLYIWIQFINVELSSQKRERDLQLDGTETTHAIWKHWKLVGVVRILS